ncbi:hypothetical protein DZC30_05790 [Comamonas testosteroni]|uniref:Uncharacterized protein n=1 Tax=Comamonas testosteroni TaxID=285 RepID=A0A373FQ30_COMTE|nr:hypothetical protein [Comamonas testosteroni]RGE45997.1 hypothetical protein DZC30_05790 [Comamonas testosteroni]
MKPPLSEQEQTLLTQYQRQPTGRWYFLNLLAVEIVPPAIFVALWAWTGRELFLLVLIALLVGFNVLRVLRQRRIRALLASISAKLQADAGE